MVQTISGGCESISGGWAYEYASVGRLCGHGEAWAWRSLVMGMGMRSMGGWLWARACVGHGASVGVVGVPWLWQGGGGEWGPHTKESIKCIPQSGTHKIQKAFLIWNSKESKGVPSPTSNIPITSIDFIKCDFPKNNKK